MAIQFPCLQKDISFWFPPNKTEPIDKLTSENSLDRDLIDTLQKFLLNSTAEDNLNITSSKSSSFHKDHAEPQWTLEPNPIIVSQPTSVASNVSQNIMSPVLKETPTSHWLANPLESNDGKQIAEGGKIQVPDLSTTLWLASPAPSGHLTCVTRSHPRVEWPGILQRTDIWLHQSPPVTSDMKAGLEAWLDKVWPHQTANNKSGGGFPTGNNGFRGTWLAGQRELTSLEAWLVNKSYASDSSNTSEAFFQPGDHAMGLVERWLCLAATDDFSSGENTNDCDNDDEFAMMEEGSSIAVLDDDEDHDDFDVVDKSWLMA